MASRYKNNEIKNTNDGRRVYRSKIYPQIPLRDDDKYVASETGDRLDTLISIMMMHHFGGLLHLQITYTMHHLD